MEAMTLLPGIDDYPKKTEVTYLTDAQNTCSGITQNTWDFSHLLGPFTG
jgi:hypothetical protein